VSVLGLHKLGYGKVTEGGSLYGLPLCHYVLSSPRLIDRPPLALLLLAGRPLACGAAAAGFRLAFAGCFAVCCSRQTDSALNQ
jgi:hypothetical protein